MQQRSSWVLGLAGHRLGALGWTIPSRHATPKPQDYNAPQSGMASDAIWKTKQVQAGTVSTTSRRDRGMRQCARIWQADATEACGNHAGI